MAAELLGVEVSHNGRIETLLEYEASNFNCVLGENNMRWLMKQSNIFMRNGYRNTCKSTAESNESSSRLGNNDSFSEANIGKHSKTQQ
jgi:hypothetical protein